MAGCAKDAPLDTFQPEGSQSQLIQDLQVPVFIIAGVVGVLVIVITAFATALQATVLDQSGNPVSGAGVTFAAPASGAGGTFPDGLTTVMVMTNASGVATVSRLAPAGRRGH